jgi:molybdopterin-binding protein
MASDTRVNEAVDQYLRGVRHRQEEHWAEALEAQRQAVLLDPDLADAHYEIGVIHLHARRPQEALSAFVRALEVDSESPEAHYGRGCAYRQLRRYEDALDAFQEALRLRPDYALAWEEIGIINGLLKRFADAVTAFERALEGEPTNARVHCALGHTYIMMGSVDRAAGELRVLEELDEDLAGLLGALITNAGRTAIGPSAAAITAISARNRLRGIVEEVRIEGLLAQVRLSFGDQTMTAIITRDAACDLDLKPGDQATAIVKSTEVMIAKEGHS